MLVRLLRMPKEKKYHKAMVSASTVMELSPLPIGMDGV